jgi:hypothetical protein
MTDTAPTDRDGTDETTHDVVTDVSDRRTALRRIAVGDGYGVVAGNFADTSALDDAADTSPAARLMASTGTRRT